MTGMYHFFVLFGLDGDGDGDVLDLGPPSKQLEHGTESLMRQ